MKKKENKKYINAVLVTLLTSSFFLSATTFKKPLKANAQDYFYEELRPKQTDIIQQYIKDDQSYSNYKMVTSFDYTVTYGTQTAYTTNTKIEGDFTQTKFLIITEIYYRTTIKTPTAERILNNYLNDNNFIDGDVYTYTTRNPVNELLTDVSISKQGLTEDLINQLNKKDVGRTPKPHINLQGMNEQTLTPINLKGDNDKKFIFYTTGTITQDAIANETCMNTISNLEGYYAVVPDNITEVIDIPNIMFNVLTMPFAFISTAFNLTLFEGTPYAINFSAIFFGMLGIAILIFIFKFLMRGGN